MSSVASIHFSHVASFVGLSFAGGGSPHRPKVRDLKKALGTNSRSVSEPSLKATSCSDELPPILAGRRDKVRSQLNLLHAEQHAHDEQMKRLDLSLNESIVNERRAVQRADKQRETMKHHKSRSVQLDKKMNRLRQEMQDMESRPTREAQEQTSSSSPKGRGLTVSIDAGEGRDASMESRSPSASPKAMANSMGLVSPAGSVSKSPKDASKSALAAKMLKQGQEAEGQQDDDPKTPSKSKPARGRSRPRLLEEQPLEGSAQGQSPDPLLSPDGGTLQGTVARLEAELRPLDTPSSPSVEARPQAIEENPSPKAAPPAGTAGAADTVSPQRASRARFGEIEEPQEDLTGRTDVATFLDSLGKKQDEMTGGEKSQLAEVRRNAVRKALRQGRTAREAFRIIDLNNSGGISPQEFGDGIPRLIKDWEKMVALNTIRHLFRLFDSGKKFSITFPDFFPEEAKLERSGAVRAPEEEFIRNYAKSRTHNMRPANWQPSGPGEELDRLGRIADRNDASKDKRKWIGSTFERLKSKGKGDARCRELVALHLPRGTGPRDRQGVHTFSKNDLAKLRQSYSEQVNSPIKEAQRGMGDLRELRREQRQIIEKLYGVVEAESAKQRAAEAVSSSLGGLSFFGSANKEEAPKEGPSSKAIQKQQAEANDAAFVKAQLEKAGMVPLR